MFQSITNLDPYPLSVIILPTEELQQLHYWGSTSLLAPISLFTVTLPACEFAGLQRKLIKQTIRPAMWT